MNVSALILTLNEEPNIERCLESLKRWDDIVILDSFSTDGTEKIAKRAGARFIQRKFDDYAAQRNYGLNKIKYKHSWLLMLDADEIVPKDFADEIFDMISNSDEDTCMFRFRRKDFLFQTWIKRSSGYPTWFGRLMRIGRVTVNRAINEQYLTDGKIGILKTHLYHYPFNKGFKAWIEKHNIYSSMESELIINKKTEQSKISDFVNMDPIFRRYAIKSIFYKLPFRPLLIFISLYLLRGGFLDGKAGAIYCFLRAFYEFMISCKVKEKKMRKMGLNI